MKKRIASAFALLAVLAAPSATAQFSTGGDVQSKPAWEQFKLDSKKTVRLTFRKASVDMVIEFFSRESGITIVKDPKLTEKITIVSPNPVSLKDAFAILDAQLGLMNFGIEKQGNLMVIRGREQRGGMGNMTPEQIAALSGGQRSETELRVYRIKFANASEVARVVNEVFLQREQQNNPFQFFGGGGGGFGGRRFGGRGGNFQAMNIGGMQGGQGPTVRASSDDYSNTVIVNAPKDQQLEVETLIEEIDQQTSAPQEVKVYPLEFAMAADIVPTIQSVLAANETTGRGGQTANNSDFFSRITRLQRGVTDGGSVVADTRTNAVVVTATAQNQTIIAQVIKELDHQVEYVDTTFVFPLSNARADSVATLLNQAFSTRNGNFGNRNGTGFNNQNRNNNNQNRNNNNQNRNQGGGGGGFQGAIEDPNDPNNMIVDLDDENAEFGDLLTQVQFRGGIGLGGQNQQNQANGQARTGTGQVVNTRQAQGNVTIIADPNTNSLIVVGDPENAEMVRNVLAQLDKIPEQVMIETIIVEATLDKSTKLGIEWDIANGKFLGNSGVSGSGETDFGLQTTPAAQGFRYSVTGGNIGGFLNALETDDKFKVLSTPRIFTSNNVEAEINISQSVPFIVSQREDVNGNFIFNYSFQDVGIVLTVTPRITANGIVSLDVVQTANDLQGFTDFNAPIVNQRQAQTTVNAKDGETIVLGGIMRSQVRATTKKIPLLGDIPLLGNLFKSVDKKEEKTELLVFLTPRIVRSPEEAQSLKDQQVGQLSNESRKSIDKVIPPKTQEEKKDGNGN